MIQSSFGYHLSEGFGNYVDQPFELCKMPSSLSIFVSFVSFSLSVVFGGGGEGRKKKSLRIQRAGVCTEREELGRLISLPDQSCGKRNLKGLE